MVFNDLIKKKNINGIFLGAPEAEAEAGKTSRVPLSQVYEDFHGLMDQLSYEKFIVVGRKGSGKSAFAEHVYLEASDQPNLFVQFIRNSEFALEKVVQLGTEEDSHFESTLLIKWIVYTNILKLFAFNQAVSDNKDYELLRQFLKKNSGYINIKEYEIRELVKKQGFDINIDQFKRFFRANFNRNLEIRSEKAPFYKLLPHLEEVLLKVLSSDFELRNKNSYVLFFDDLDVGFSANNKASTDALISLVRVCKDLNNNVFGKNGINAKVILLLRDDIEAYLSTLYADSAKIFSSYSAKIVWFQDGYNSNIDEDELYIKRFINKRISYAFKASGKQFNENDPWLSLVSPGNDKKSSFKYIVNNTLFRPRDLLLFFKPLENGAYKYPLNYNDIRILASQYSDELAKEIKNELSSFYDSQQIETLFLALGCISNYNYNYRDALDVFRQSCKEIEPNDVLEFMYDRSLIGNVDNSGWFTFKCREPIGSSLPSKIDVNKKIVVQYGIRNYVQSKAYSK